MISHVLIDNARYFKTDWRGMPLYFGAWADDDSGHYVYESENGQVNVVFEVREFEFGKEIVLLELNGETLPSDLPAVVWRDGECFLDSCLEIPPQDVPAAIVMVFVWAEEISQCPIN